MAKKGKGRIIRVNFQGVQVRGMIPEGDYIVKVVKVTTEEGPKGEYLNWELEIVGPSNEGRKLWHKTSLVPQALWNLRATLEALGFDVPDSTMDIDLKALRGLEMGVTVEHEKYQGKTKNRVVDVFPADELRDRGDDEDEDEDDDDEDEDDDDEDDE